MSWRILLEDLNIAWAQHRKGQPVVLPTSGTSFAQWASLLAEHARDAAVVEQADAWRQVAATHLRCRQWNPTWTPSPLPGTYRRS
ncbi:condensation domain protein [Mycobacterium xenopi 4042]|uniref:Condensation domain protein n=1 Tax=Mycobacterium xenopi 4042 TaxID=1299334 RepID=X7YMN4_MYCXE|nr:condensation domain protein [Mycobacterium xenopi 4042]